MIKLRLPKLQRKAKWEVCRTIWPYRDGYGTWCEERKTLMHHGFLKREAQTLCDELNAREDVVEPVGHEYLAKFI